MPFHPSVPSHIPAKTRGPQPGAPREGLLWDVGGDDGENVTRGWTGLGLLRPVGPVFVSVRTPQAFHCSRGTDTQASNSSEGGVCVCVCVACRTHCQMCCLKQ